jgi:hypothetical protein
MDTDKGASIENAPQLDSIETTKQKLIPATYREHLDVTHWPEVLKVEQLYAYIDERDNSKKLQRFQECRTVATLYRDRETHKLLIAANQCKLRWCPYCQQTRSYRVKEQTAEWLKTVSKPRFITLTLKHSRAPLNLQLHHLYEAFKEFRRLKATREHIRGGLWFLEIKYNIDREEYHPHLHLLVEGKFWPKESVSKAWQKASKTSFVADIRSIHNNEKAIEYVAKYAAKGAEITLYPHNIQVEIYDCLDGKRSCGTWGSARVIRLTQKGINYATIHERVCSFSVLRKLLIDGNQEAWLLWDSYLTKRPYHRDIGIAEYEDFVSEDVESDFDEFESRIKQYSFW